MNPSEIASVVISAFSIFLGVLAIWLSLHFYKMSCSASDRIRDVAGNIDAKANQLQTLFDTLYHDTFSMLREIVGRMSNRLFSESQIERKVEEDTEKKAKEKATKVKDEIEIEVDKLLEGKTTVQDSVKKLIERGINETRKVVTEARQETVQEYILEQLKTTRTKTAQEIINNLEGIPARSIIGELRRMKSKDLVSWDGEGELAPNTKISLGPTGYLLSGIP